VITENTLLTGIAKGVETNKKMIWFN